MTTVFILDPTCSLCAFKMAAHAFWCPEVREQAIVSLQSQRKKEEEEEEKNTAHNVPRGE